jgi:HK97 family phage portal protein
MILKALVRSLERPGTPLSDPDEWLVEDLAGAPTATGLTVNASTALTYAAFFRGVNLISRDVAKIPLLVYERIEGGGKERATRHAAYKLLRYAPNEAMHAVDFKKLLQAQAILRGNGYAFIERAGSGAPGALLPLNSANVSPLRVGGIVWYLFYVGGEPIKVLWRDMFHVKGLPDWDREGLEGISVLTKARESLALGLAARQYGARFFGNDARPGAVLEHPGKLSPQGHANLIEDWEKAHRGVSNKHRMAILEEGMKLHSFSIPARDAQLIETRQFEIRDMANWLGLPPHRLGDTTRTSFASLEQENQSYLDDALDGWLVAWEAEGREKLLTEREKDADTHVVEFLRAALVRADLGARVESYNKAILGGWMSRDEARERENLGPIPGGEGKKFFVPSNVTVAGQGSKSGSPDGSVEKDQEPGAGEADPGRGPGTSAAPAGGRDGGGRVDGDGAPGDLVLAEAARSIIRRATLSSCRAASDPRRLQKRLAGLVERHQEPARAILSPLMVLGGLPATQAAPAARELLEAVAASLAKCRSPEEVRAVGAVLERDLAGGFAEELRKRCASETPPASAGQEHQP